MAVVADEASAEGDGTPPRSSNADDVVGAKPLEGRDPEDLGDDVRDEEESDEIAELVARKADGLLEAEDTGIAEIGAVNVVEQDEHEGSGEKVNVKLAEDSLFLGWVDVDGRGAGRFAVARDGVAGGGLALSDAVLLVTESKHSALWLVLFRHGEG